MRECSICRERKPLDEFFGDKGKPLGKDYRCKLCDVQRKLAVRQSKKGEKMKLTEQKLEQLLTGLAQAERKIYNLLPSGAYWSTSQIFAEAKRKGINIPITAIKGTSIELVKMGIAKNSGDDQFCKVEVARAEKAVVADKKKDFDLKTITKQVASFRSMADSLITQAGKAREHADTLEMMMVYLLELEERAESKALESDKEFQAFLAFKAAIKG